MAVGIGIKERINEITDSIIKQVMFERAQQLCAFANYQIEITGSELQNEDMNMYYDPLHADEFTSHLLKNFSDVFRAYIQVNSDGTYSIIIESPKNMSYTDEVKEKIESLLSMSLSNTYRLAGITQ